MSMREPRQLYPRQNGFTKVGKISAHLAKSRKAFANVPSRQIDDPEKPIYVLPEIAPPTSDEYTCEHCGQSVSESGNYHGWFRGPDGQPVECPVCSKPVIRARNRRKADTYLRALVHDGALLDTVNLPVDAHLCSLAKYPGKQEYIGLIQEFIDGDATELFFTGLTGRGKTGLAISAVHEIWKQRKQVLFMPMERYLDLLKENFRDGAQPNHIKQILTSVEYLVIDDIGAGVLSEASTGFAVKETQDLIEARHAAGLHTLITSNLTVDGLGAYWYMAKYERAGFQPSARIVSRLKGWYRVVEIKGNDLRIEE